MKSVVLFILIGLSCIKGYAQRPSLEGTPFRRADLDIRWNAPTNSWPSGLWTYRVEPTNFSPTVIAELKALASFTDKDKATPPGGPDPRRLYYVSPDKLRTLSIIPVCRAVDYKDRAADNVAEGAGVPDAKEAVSLATDFLSKSGIDRSELATKGGDLRIMRTKREGMIFTNNAFVTNINSRGVLFLRSIDGTVVRGTRTSTCQINYANHGRLAHVSLLWPRWERMKNYPTVGPQTIMQRIRDGSAVLSSLPADVAPIDWPSVKRVTIIEAEAVYTGDAKNVLEARIYPYAALKASIDTGQTNIDAEIHCPILGDSEQ